jgi:Prolyl 4-Hydroxylase alpha-subunit, N-terminal region
LSLLEKEMEELIQEYGAYMPNQEDLNNAALSIVLLQDTYNLNMTDLVRGNILGHKSYVEMSGKFQVELSEWERIKRIEIN